MKNIIAVLSFILLSTAPAFAAKGYQVTGPVVDLTDTTITVMKGKEKWEITRDAKTKGIEGVKKGDKVTIYYGMVAQEIEAKAEKKGK